jgi:hypothetical protein
MISGLLLAAAAGVVPAALADDLDLSIEGYYRTRGYLYPNLFADQTDPGQFISQRLRVQPVLNYQDKAKFSFMADVMDDVVWGDNADRASTALFANDPSMTGYTGTETDAFRIKRAWMEVNIPVGVIRVGRQPSHWGLGLLANSGDGFDDTFGENHQGNNFDRILFATRPIAIIQAAAGRDDTEIPFFIGAAMDRLVEDPLTQYYGYECSSGLTDGVDDDFDPRCDADGDGISELEHDYTESRDASTRGDDWWVDRNDDVYELVLLAIYRGEELAALDYGDLTIGAYAINRQQAETNSNVWILDAYTRFEAWGIYAEGEILNIRGQSSAIALPGTVNYDPDADPLQKEVDIWGYVGRLGYQHRGMASLTLEHGYASGDDNVSDEVFTGRSLHPDYNVGLILYDEILSRVTQNTWTDSADGLWSRGGVYNSRYLFPTTEVQFLDNQWSVIGGLLVVWPDRPDGSRILCAEGDKVDGEKLDCALYEATADTLGWEVDAAIKGRFHEHVLFSLEAGYAQVTDRIPLENVGLSADGAFFTLQSRLAYEF